MNIKRLLTITGLCLGGILHAQENEDYVVTMERDTIFGKITSVTDKKLKIKTATTKRTFRPNEVFRAMDNKKVYAPSRVEYGLERVPGIEPKLYHFSERKATKPPTFAEVITDGEIVLYYFIKTSTAMAPAGFAGGQHMPGMFFTSNQKNYFAIKKSTGDAIEIKKSGFYLFGNMSKKKIAINLAKLIEDEAEWMKKFEEEDSLNLDRFIEYIEGYNKLRKAKGHDPERYDFQIF
ncbi:hypothetical protein H8B06_05850 [Sphingobacterium sp. DN00404]|uniref:GLPGLI family protein n=1 Tax=Sphingobacterium micropteri TaxID=2763501 RepID=A0ABR7YLY6_9SPHI|nr:hypothetical protein [Sphingobacterium micropteri]MBD1432340.1 hypothetical protein [Sphingobacterium micropteri]